MSGNTNWQTVTVVLAAVAGGKASATFGDAHVGLVVAGAVVVVSWIVHSWRRPNTRCLRCNGDPKDFAGSGRSWSYCWLCGGSGRRRRFWVVVLGRGFGKV